MIGAKVHSPWCKGKFTRVPSHLSSIHAILAVESMEVETHYFTHVSSHIILVRDDLKLLDNGGEIPKS